MIEFTTVTREFRSLVHRRRHLMTFLGSVFAGASAALLALALDLNLPVAGAVGLGVFALWLVMYFRFHHQATAFAFFKIANDGCAPFDREAWREHVSLSLEDANTGLLSDIG